MKWVNQYSFVVGGVFILLLAGGFVFRQGFNLRGGIGVIAVLLGLAGLWLVVKPKAGVDASAEKIRSEIGAGSPVLLEFQSQY